MLKGGVTAALLTIVIYGEPRSLESIGIHHPTRRDFGGGIVVTVVGLFGPVATFAVGPLFGPEPDSAAPSAPPTSACRSSVRLTPPV